MDIQFTTRVVCLILVIILFSFHCCDTYDEVIYIPAFDYIRVFGNLSLGQCVHRVSQAGDQPVEERCMLHPASGTVFNKTKPLFVRGVYNLTGTTDALHKFGLCDGVYSSRIGLLHRGECFAARLARKLTFSNKHVVLAYIDYGRPKIGKLDASDLHIPSDYSHYYENQFYLKEIEYGTKEILVVEMTFRKNISSNLARQIRLNPDAELARNAEDTIRLIGQIPRKMKLLYQSTGCEMSDVTVTTDLTQAFDLMKQKTQQIRQTMEELRTDRRACQLTYAFHPFIPSNIGRLRSATVHVQTKIQDLKYDELDKAMWDNITTMEIASERTHLHFNKMWKYCDNTTTAMGVCNRLKTHLRHTKKIRRTLHNVRARWHITLPFQKELVRDIEMMRLEYTERHLHRDSNDIKTWLERDKNG